jgi:hypothetical protein
MILEFEGSSSRIEALFVLVALAGLVLGIGIISFVISNWELIPDKFQKLNHELENTRKQINGRMRYFLKLEMNFVLLKYSFYLVRDNSYAGKFLKE